MTHSSEVVQPVTDLVPQPIEWLWRDRLGGGKLSMFDGDPEMGKSLVTLDLCAHITTGRPFPDGAPAIAPSNVIILNGEDSAADTVVPRLCALGADLDRVFLFRKDHLDKAGPFRLPTHTRTLDRALADTGAALVVLDPIMAFLDPSIHVAGDRSVRLALSPLAEIAEQRGCHVILVRHLNKTGHFRSMYRGGGSIGLVAACRSAYLFARDPQEAEHLVMAQIKNNLGPRQPSLSYRIQVQPGGLPAVEWLGESRLSADQLLAAAAQKPRLPRPRDRARDFLSKFLEAGPRSTLDIWEAAQKEDLSQRTLRRVRRKMRICSQTAWTNNRLLTYWLLQGQRLPPESDAPDPDVPSLEPWLAPLREQFPGDPLDDGTEEW